MVAYASDAFSTEVQSDAGVTPPEATVAWLHATPLPPPLTPAPCKLIKIALLLLLQVVNKNIYNAELTKLLGANAFSQAPRLAVQMIELFDKGRVIAQSSNTPLSLSCPLQYSSGFCHQACGAFLSNTLVPQTCLTAYTAQRL